MSSLMQHHGGRSADGRKVELLMYLTERFEEKPLSCSHCGQEWRDEVFCKQCHRFVLFVRQYPPQGEPVDIVTMEAAIERAEPALVGNCYSEDCHSDADPGL